MSTAPGTPETTAVLEGRTKGQERIRNAGGGLTRLLCRPVVTGLDDVPSEGGFIVASNHLSFLDSVLIQGIFPRPVSFIAKKEYFTQPGVSGRAKKLFFESFGSVPVDRTRQSGAVEALFGLTTLINAGYGIGIYPEGTRSRDGRLYRGKNGVGWLALATGVPVLPVGLIGTEKLQPPDRTLIRPTKFHMHIGEPLRFEHLGEKHPLPVRRQATAQIMDAIAELSGQQRVQSYNAPPSTPPTDSSSGTDG